MEAACIEIIKKNTKRVPFVTYNKRTTALIAAKTIYDVCGISPEITLKQNRRV